MKKKEQAKIEKEGFTPRVPKVIWMGALVLVAGIIFIMLTVFIITAIYH